MGQVIILEPIAVARERDPDSLAMLGAESGWGGPLPEEEGNATGKGSQCLLSLWRKICIPQAGEG